MVNLNFPTAHTKDLDIEYESKHQIINIRESTTEEIKVKNLLSKDNLNINDILSSLNLPTIQSKDDLFVLINEIEQSNILEPHKILNLKKKLLFLNSAIENEEKIDKMEIKLSRLKKQYGNLYKNGNYDINSLKSEIYNLENHGIILDKETVQNINHFLFNIKKSLLDSEFSIFLNFNKDILKLFDFILENEEIINNIRQEKEILLKIENECNESLAKKILIELIRRKEMSISEISACIGLDKYVLMETLQELEYNNMIVIHRITQTISLKKVDR